MDELRRRIFERIEERVEAEISDGLNAYGEFSPEIKAKQEAFLRGIRVGGLAAANVAVI
jgi:hypothetical protein